MQFENLARCLPGSTQEFATSCLILKVAELRRADFIARPFFFQCFCHCSHQKREERWHRVVSLFDSDQATCVPALFACFELDLHVGVQPSNNTC